MKIQDVYTHAHLQKRQGVEPKYIGSTNGITQIHNKEYMLKGTPNNPY